MMQEVVEQIENTIKDVMASNLHTAFPAEITELDLEEGLVNVQPIGSYYNNGEELDYPEIPSIPLVINASNDREFACVQPIKEGDKVLVVCSEQSLSEFLTETSEDQMDERYELQNGIAIPGIQRESIEAQLEANEDDAWILQYGEVKIKVTSEKIEITGDIEIEGDIKIVGNVEMEGDYTLTGSEDITGDLTVSGSADISGGADISSGLTVTGGLTVSGGADISGSTSISGNLDVSGNITCGGSYPSSS